MESREWGALEEETQSIRKEDAVRGAPSDDSSKLGGGDKDGTTHQAVLCPTGSPLKGEEEAVCCVRCSRKLSGLGQAPLAARVSLASF